MASRTTTRNAPPLVWQGLRGAQEGLKAVQLGPLGRTIVSMFKPGHAWLPVSIERLDEIGAVPSIGSVADSYDIALAETINGPYTTGVIRRRGPWPDVDQVELATLNWVQRFNTERLHALGDIPPTEFEARHTSTTAA